MNITQEARDGAEPLFMSIYGDTKYVVGDSKDLALRTHRKHFQEAFQRAIDSALAKCNGEPYSPDLTKWPHEKQIERLRIQRNVARLELDELKSRCDKLTKIIEDVLTLVKKL